MAKRKRGLGRGLSELMAENQAVGPKRSRYGAIGAPMAAPVSTSDGSPEDDHRTVSEILASDDVSRETIDEPRVAMPSVGEILGSRSSSIVDSQILSKGGLTAGRLQEIPIDSIVPNAQQPRTIFDEDELEELSASIADIGVLQPIVVRPQENGYELIMGERRWRASQKAGLKKIPAIVREVDDNNLLRDALVENIHRSQLNPLEEAAAYEQLLKDFSCTQADVAKMVSKSRSQVTNILRLLRLPASVQKRVAAGVISNGHARALLGLETEAAMELICDRIVKEGLSVRATEEIVAMSDTVVPQRAKEPKKPNVIPAEFEQRRLRLMDTLDTNVVVKPGKNKGRIVIDFADQEDLDRIISLIVR